MHGKQFLKIMTLGVATIISTVPAFAALSAPRGYYLEGNYGNANLSDRTYVSGVQDYGSVHGANAIVGYKYNPYVGGEFGYTFYSDTKLRNSAGTKIATEGHQGLHLALKGMVPTKYGIEPFAKLGVARLKSDVSLIDTAAAAAVGLTGKNSTKIGAYFGAGVQYYYSPMAAIVAQWSRTKGNSKTGTMNLYTIGLSLLMN